MSVSWILVFHWVNFLIKIVSETRPSGRILLRCELGNVSRSKFVWRHCFKIKRSFCSGVGYAILIILSVFNPLGVFVMYGWYMWQAEKEPLMHVHVLHFLPSFILYYVALTHCLELKINSWILRKENIEVIF